MRDLIGIRKVGESALRLLADMFADDSYPADPADVNVDATIVFADLEGFSDVVAREGDEAASAILDRLDLAVDAVLAGTSARLVKRLGDGVMIAAPHPEDGLRAAAHLPSAFADSVADLPYRIRIRVGGHRGTVRQRDDDLIGYHVNVAARVAEAAPGGAAYVTEALITGTVLPTGVAAAPVGQLVAKGVPERPPLHRLRLVPAPAD